MEKWDVLDKNGRKTGRTIDRGAIPEGVYHLVADAWIKNGRGEYLISRRSPDKFPDAGLWSPTCGSVIAGESSFAAAIREANEELGVTLDPQNGRFVTRSFNGRRTFFDVWLFKQDIDIESVRLQPGETDAAAWAGPGEIKRLSSEGKFLSPNKMEYLDALLEERLGRPSTACAVAATKNAAAMADFYSKIFVEAPTVSGPDNRFINSGFIVFDLESAGASSEPTRNMGLIIKTESADAEHGRLAALGIDCGEPTDKPWGVRSFAAADPDGNVVSFASDIN
ncbi:MAG: NUDIX domain-containing protein [Defluviitaleaceae bacterium]|nr:NUDIX domain-containing protein [Defluviitaleaceae bacterium]